MVTIRGMSQSDLPAILDLVSELADWFDEDARQRSMPIDLRHQDGLVAVDGNQVLGFLTWYVAEGRANIGWLAVDRAWRRRGIGRSLVDALTVHVKPTGIQEIATYTLGDSVEYAPYAETRAFYFSNGFAVYERMMSDNPSCPEAIKIKRPIA